MLNSSQINSSFANLDSVHNPSTAFIVPSLHRPTRKDAELSCENTSVVSQYPYFYQTSESNPIKSRYRSTSRTKLNFNDVNKLNIDTPETILKKEEDKNPYKLNRAIRQMTKSQ